VRHVLSLLAAVAVVAVPLAGQTVRYEVSVPDPSSQLFHVKAEFPAAGKDTLLLSLPAWSPGNYEIQNYARYVRHFTARDAAGKSLFWDRADKDTWRVAAGKSARVTAEFDFLADTIDFSIARIRGDFGQFLGTNLFLFEEGQLARPAEVRFALPTGWRVTTALKPGSGGVYVASDYHELADAETFVGKFALDSVPVDGHWIRLALWPGEDYTPAVAQSLRTSIAKIGAEENAIMGGPSYDVYTIFFNVEHDPVSFGGGLEHSYGQYDIMPAGPDFATPDGHLGSFMHPLLAHELFHSWNVKRIRPAAMWPYDYHAEQYTPLLWWSEGVTDYYADLTNLRSGLWTAADFLGNAEQNVEQIESAPEPWSEEDGSEATWISEVFVNSSQLYYPKGSVTGLLLDISMRDATGNRHGLDDVMRALFTRYYRENQGFTTADLLSLLKEFGVPDAAGFYARYIRGREPLPYDSVLAKAGIAVHHDSVSSPFLGVGTAASPDGKVMVQHVNPGTAAEAADVRPGDILIQVGDVNVAPDSDWASEFRAHYRGKAGAPLPITVQRDGRRLTLQAKVQEHVSTTLSLSLVPAPTASQARVWHGLSTGALDR